MYLTLRLTPGLFKLFPYPRPEEFWHFVRSCLPRIKKAEERFTCSIESNDIQGLVVIAEGLVTSLRKSQYVPFGVPLVPIQFIVHHSPQAPKSAWPICPPGFMLIPGDISLPHLSKWIYNFSVLNVSSQAPISNMLFPYRTLLLTGPSKNECFFCGSHWHDTRGCPSFFTGKGQGAKLVEQLCKSAPDTWKDVLRGEKQDQGLLDGIFAVMEHLRYPFRPIYALRVIHSKEEKRLLDPNLNLIPERLKKPWGEIYDAMDAGDLRRLESILEKVDQGDTVPCYSILNGLFNAMKGNIDHCIGSLKLAQNLSRSNREKAYSALLESRAQFLWGSMEGAIAAVKRALSMFPKDPDVGFWHASLLGIRRREKEISRLIDKWRANDHTLIRLLCEPLLSGCAGIVEEGFKDVLEERQDSVDMEMSLVETLLSQAQTAFPNTDFTGLAVELRDIKGRLPMLGLSSLKETLSALQGLRRKIYQEIGKEYNRLYSRLLEARKRLVYCVKKVPKHHDFYDLSVRCTRALEAITDTLKQMRVVKKMEAMAEVHDVVTRWEQLVEKLEDEVDKEVNKRYQLTILKRYLAIAIALTGGAWALFYIIHLLKELVG